MMPLPQMSIQRTTYSKSQHLGLLFAQLDRSRPVMHREKREESMAKSF
jgi:hypothetical protein